MVQIRSAKGGKEVCYDENVACGVTYTANRGSDMQRKKKGWGGTDHELTDF